MRICRELKVPPEERFDHSDIRSREQMGDRTPSARFPDEFGLVQERSCELGFTCKTARTRHGSRGWEGQERSEQLSGACLGLTPSRLTNSVHLTASSSLVYRGHNAKIFLTPVLDLTRMPTIYICRHFDGIFLVDLHAPAQATQDWWGKVRDGAVKGCTIHF